ncbi:hypothetical protein [Pedobacter gandavensis]|uniref:heavy-metal-associated domain-containing protein n=1 Tax=Pedobacter gandavensis TaxID=2679963 RepID=UPI002930AC10|nr:hypothetical protein [Pedobacter gandavensis]
MFKSLIIAVLFCAAISNKSLAQNIKSVTDTTITIKVKGITCGNDLKTLSENVKVLKGVTDCKPGKAGPVSAFKITFNPTVVDTKTIYQAIENTGGCSDPNEKPYKVKAN